MSSTAISKERVQKFLTEIFGTIQLDADGDYSVERKGARVYLRVLQMNEKSTVVNVFSLVARGLAPELGLYESVNEFNQSMRFGTATLIDAEDGTKTYMLSHTLLADYLDKDELGYVVVGILEGVQQLLGTDEDPSEGPTEGAPAESPAGSPDEVTLD